MFEKYLIRHCSPTLAGIKMSNLFTYYFSSEKVMLEEVKNCNIQLKHKGIIVSVLKKKDNKALIYVYRKNKLSQVLCEGRIAKFLKNCGYTMITADKSLAILKHRISDNMDFPHEIGVFLGYPIEDVIGFIENSGRNCKCLGCWKVYCNECEAKKVFERYKKCTSVYMNLYDCGTPVTKLAVAV